VKLLVALLLAACSGAPLATDFEMAQAREAAHDDDGARSLYEKVRVDCATHPRPHDDCALAIVREAQLDEKHHRFAEAVANYRAAAERAQEPRKAARALARAALITADELRDDDAAERLAWRTVEKWPDEMGADDALALAVRIGKKRDPAALARKLDALWPRVAKLDLGDNVLWERAELSRIAGDAAGAIHFYDELAKNYLRSSLRDDAIWQAAHLLRDAGDTKRALAHLQIILDSRRDALITGSYNSIWLDDAQLLKGQILLDDLHENARAAEAFALLADDYPESVLKDDALVELARADVALGKPADACAALERLFKKYPDSNRLRQGRALYEELACRK
jgi:tetratricopeptide (TPR) repeat protein